MHGMATAMKTQRLPCGCTFTVLAWRDMCQPHKIEHDALHTRAQFEHELRTALDAERSRTIPSDIQPE